MQIAELQYQLDSSILTQRILRLRIGETDVRIFMDRVAAKLKPAVAAPGFRKGKAPLALIRRHYKDRIEAEAFEELKRAALDQVLKQIKEEDKPFLPPEVQERGLIRLRYGQPLEFTLKYMVDPAGVSRKTGDEQKETPEREPSVPTVGRLPVGVPTGPALPQAPTAQSGVVIKAAVRGAQQLRRD